MFLATLALKPLFNERSRYLNNSTKSHNAPSCQGISRLQCLCSLLMTSIYDVNVCALSPGSVLMCPPSHCSHQGFWRQILKSCLVGHQKRLSASTGAPILAYNLRACMSSDSLAAAWLSVLFLTVQRPKHFSFCTILGKTHNALFDLFFG